MEFTAAAQWLNNTFAGMDSIILGFMNSLADAAGGFLTPFMKLLTLLGEKGIAMFLLAFIFMLFPRTRKAGVCIFGAVCCGALITNIVLKDMVARPRPFESMASFQAYWRALGSPVEDGFSFPSGHVTALTAGMSALCLCKGRKFVLPSVLAVLLMAMSRCYLMAHFPSDVLAAMLVGLFSAFIAWLIASLIFNYCEDNDDLPFCDFIMYFAPLSFIPGLGALKEKSAALFAGKASSRKGGRRSAEDEGRGSGKHGAESAKSRGVPGVDLTGISGKLSSLLKRGNNPAENGRHSAPTDGGKHSASSEDGFDARGGVGAVLREIKLPSRPKRETADWNERWNEYRSRKPAGSSVADTAGEFSFSIDDFVSDRPAPSAEQSAASDTPPEADADAKLPSAAAEGDEDMKIAPTRSAPAAPSRPAPDAAEDEDVLLHDMELHDILSGQLTEFLPEEPASNKSAFASFSSVGKKSAYRGKHEK